MRAFILLVLAAWPAIAQPGAAPAASDSGRLVERAHQDREIVYFLQQPEADGSVRLRIAETYTDPGSYRLEGDELVFDRSFGRPRNAIVLPAGWYLTASSIPAMVSESADGRIKARRRKTLARAEPREEARLREIAARMAARKGTG